MSLIRCPECDREISNKVKACPHCGFPFDSNVMKEPPIVKSDRSTKNYSQISQNGKPLNKKRIVLYALIGLVFVLIAILLFVIIQRSNQKSRIDEFNAELQTRLEDNWSEDMEQEIVITGNFGESVEFIRNTDDYTIFDSDNLAYEDAAYVLVWTSCTTVREERAKLMLEYIYKEEYQKDKNFLNVTDTPYCAVVTSNERYEYIENKLGEDVFLIDGEEYTYTEK